MFLSFYIACVIIPVGFLIYLVASLVFKNSSQVIMCMECEQCMGVCPVLKKNGGVFPGPKGIMVAAKSGKVNEAIQNGALMCTNCGLCERACPRGLSAGIEVEKWKKKYKQDSAN